jgi:hypothetical protein
MENLRIVEERLLKNKSHEDERIQELYKQIGEECKKYQQKRQEYLSFLLIGKFQEQKQLLLKEETERLTQEMNAFKSTHDSFSKQTPVSSQQSNNENHFNQLSNVSNLNRSY